MRMHLATALIIASLAGCALPPPKPGSSHREAPTSSKDLTVGFGSLGPAKVGMAKSEALGTDLFDRTRFRADDACKATALKPKDQFENIEVRTDKSGTIHSFRIVGPGPKTLYGIGVGTYYADMVGSYASALKGPTKIGADRSGVFVRKNKAWIGFLFNEPLDELDVEDKVALIEVTQGDRPDLNPSC